MEYKLKPVDVLSSPEGEITLPNKKERIIEKHGEILYLSIHDIEENIKHNQKTKKEVQAKLDLEKAKKENIEHYHDFVLDMSPEDLHTAHMYKESSSWVEICKKQLDALNEQERKDNDEIEEILKQIPILVEEVESEQDNNSELVKSPYVENK